jgi:uncharacterized membrane protein YhiD involved in acid resistance
VDTVTSVAAQAEWIKTGVGAAATLLAALIVTIFGTLGVARITRNLQRERNRQDQESQWRSHAIELTKLDAERLARAACV